MLSTAVALDQLGGNTFAKQSGFAGIIFAGAHVDKTSTFPATGDAMLGLGFGNPVLNEWAGLRVDNGVTATLSAGTTVKGSDIVNGTCCLSNALVVHGTLVASGTAASPVTFTSCATTRSAATPTATAPAPSPPPATGAASASAPAVRHCWMLRICGLRRLGLTLGLKRRLRCMAGSPTRRSGSGRRRRSSMHPRSIGVIRGPAPVGTGTPIQGDGVYVATWVGMPPAPPPPSDEPIPADTSPATDTQSCADIVVVTVRGSGEGPQGEAPGYGFAESDDKLIAVDGAVGRSYDMYYGFKQQLALENDETVDVRALKYRALGVFYVGLPSEYFTSIDDGVRQLVKYLKRARPACKPGQKVALAGYSQGALVIHLALRRLKRDGREELMYRNRLAAVMLSRTRPRSPMATRRRGRRLTRTRVPGFVRPRASGAMAGGMATEITDRCRRRSPAARPRTAATTTSSAHPASCATYSPPSGVALSVSAPPLGQTRTSIQATCPSTSTPSAKTPHTPTPTPDKHRPVRATPRGSAQCWPPTRAAAALTRVATGPKCESEALSPGARGVRAAVRMLGDEV